ncbi:BON domain-containing protein [Pseudohongiella acticola]|jgi:hyperosmotically inducible periplasmic protein|uniref:BON domain-containing protein n=1 Tax=Pseudohongiella acticola TaxID=1524254 RepID=UPI0030EE2391
MLRKKLIRTIMIANLTLVGATSAYADDDNGRITEARINGQIWGTYAVNTELNPFDLDIDVSGDTVTLTGAVDHDAKSQLAEEIAMGIDGVNEVNNRITVQPDSRRAEDDPERSFGQLVSDATTTATVKSKLLMDDDVAGLEIDVTTKDDVVTLTGDVDSTMLSSRARELASQTDGVDRVINNIAVR